MSTKRSPLFLVGALAATAVCAWTTGACGSDAATKDADLPAVYQKFLASVEVYREGDQIVVHSDGMPNHGSPYFDPSDSRYQPYDGPNPLFFLNPNRIRQQDFTFRLPASPALDAAHPATPLGPIGVALNGVAIFNQYAAGRAPLGPMELNTFDQYNAHPQQTGVYHYHREPLYLTKTLGREALLGFLLDGFPVYGPDEQGTTVHNRDLDEFHGHFGPTTDFPQGIYHYHVTDELPYINGTGFYGNPGTVSQ